jgi:hypothetical protein
MKFILVTLLFTLTSQYSWSQEEFIKDVVTDPAVSLRCKELIYERNNKIKFQQKLKSLLSRTKKLQKKVPTQKDSIKMSLKMSEVELGNEIYLTNLKVQSMEENIVRSGCPGITL